MKIKNNVDLDVLNILKECIFTYKRYVEHYTGIEIEYYINSTEVSKDEYDKVTEWLNK